MNQRLRCEPTLALCWCGADARVMRFNAPSSRELLADLGAADLGQVQFRRASLADVSCLVGLVHSAYRGETSRAGWTTEADLLNGQRTDSAEVRELVLSTSSHILVADWRGELLACVSLKQGPDAVHVGMLAVRPTLQALGLGRRMLSEVENVVLNERMPKHLCMTVIAQRTELIAWYERRGYRRTGRSEAFPYHEPRFGLPTRPDLYFEVLEKILP